MQQSFQNFFDFMIFIVIVFIVEKDNGLISSFYKCRKRIGKCKLPSKAFKLVFLIHCFSCLRTWGLDEAELCLIFDGTTKVEETSSNLINKVYQFILCYAYVTLSVISASRYAKRNLINTLVVICLCLVWSNVRIDLVDNL